jgi:hypothetical protein
MAVSFQQNHDRVVEKGEFFNYALIATSIEVVALVMMMLVMRNA